MTTMRRQVADLCEEFKVVAMRVGEYDCGTRWRFTMADGVRREFSIDCDNDDAGFTEVFNWILWRVEGGADADTDY